MTTPQKHSRIIEAVESWVEHVIVGLNFCPFAKKEVVRNTIRYCISESDSKSTALDVILKEFTVLDKEADVQTTLIIFASGFSEFDDYLDLIDSANQLIELGGYNGLYQIATFHPEYCFEGEETDDPANYTNRSPYPIVHLLRESSLDSVLKTYVNPEQIPINNIEKARKLGVNYFKNVLKQGLQS